MNPIARLAIVAAVCAAIVATAWLLVAWLRRRAALAQGARLDRNPAYAIDSAGRAYEAVPVTRCTPCGGARPADHQCTGRSA